MPVIRIDSTQRGQGRDRESMLVTGRINVTARVGSYPAGSFGLNHLQNIMLTSSTVKQGVTGSVRDPETTYRNTVLLRSIFTGTTGSRSVVGIGAIGSTTGAGTTSRANFMATGY